MEPINRIIAPGVRFLSLPDDRFKTTSLTIALLLPLAEETASANALLPFLLRRGCSKYPDFTALNLRLNQLYGATVSADVSRVGETQMLILTAGSINDRYALDKESVVTNCAELLLEMLFRPALENGLFRAEDFEQERRCMVERLDAEINEKRIYARHRCEKLLCEGEPYAINRFGTREQVQALTPEKVTDAWKVALQTARVQIIAQGSGDFDTVAKSVERAFEQFNRVPVEYVMKNEPVHEVHKQTEHMDVSQCKMVMGFKTEINANHPLVPAMRVMNALLGGTAHSFLFKNVREKLSLCYYCSSSYDRHKGVMLIDSGVMPEKVEEADEAILKQLQAIQNGEFTAEDLEYSRLSIVNQYGSLNDLQSTQAGWYLGQCLYDTIQTTEQAIAEMSSVTKEDVIRAANTLRQGSLFLLAPDGSTEKE